METQLSNHVQLHPFTQFSIGFQLDKTTVINMHSFRLRYIVLGLLIYIQNAFCRTCGSDFEDVPSRAILADIVMEGKVDGKSTNGNANVLYNATFAVKKVLKGSLPQSKSEYLPVIVGDFGPEDADRCITEVTTGSNYVVFLQDREDQSEPYHRTAGFPEPTSRQALRDVRKITCPKCGKYKRRKYRSGLHFVIE